MSLRTWKPGSMLSYQVPTATRQSVPNLWSSSSLMTYNDNNTYHIISCKLRSNNFELLQTVFWLHFYLLLCHDKVPKHASVKTNCKENNISQEYKKHCVSRVCRVRCKTHGSFVTVIMDKQTRKMYIRFQKRAIIITPVHKDFEWDTTDKGTQKILLCNVYQGHQDIRFCNNDASDQVSANGTSSIPWCNKKSGGSQDAL